MLDLKSDDKGRVYRGQPDFAPGAVFRDAQSLRSHAPSCPDCHFTSTEGDFMDLLRAEKATALQLYTAYVLRHNPAACTHWTAPLSQHSGRIQITGGQDSRKLFMSLKPLFQVRTRYPLMCI